MEAARRDHKQLIRAGSQENRERFLVRGKGSGKTSSGGLPRKYDKFKKTMKMKKFTKFFDERPEDFRGHKFNVDTRTLTVPDATKTLKEIILSGAQALVGTPQYDDSPEAGVQRLIIQNAPLEMILNAQLGDFPEDDEPSTVTKTKEGDAQAKESGAADNSAAPQTAQNAE